MTTLTQPHLGTARRLTDRADKVGTPGANPALSWTEIFMVTIALYLRKRIWQALPRRRLIMAAAVTASPVRIPSARRVPAASA